MAKVICVSNQKGGSGKTTTTINIAAALALEKGYKILMADADGQANLTTAFGLNPDDIQEKGSSFYNLMTNKKNKTADFVVPSGFKNLDLLPGAQNTYKLDQELIHMTRREYRLNNVLKSIKGDYDFIFIDTPPHLGHTTFNAFVACDYVVVVYTAGVFALDGISQLVETIYEIQDDDELNLNGTEIIGCLWNSHNPSTLTVNKQVEKELKDVKILKKHFPKISRATVIEQAQAACRPVLDFAPKHKVSDQYREVAREILKCVK